MPAQGVGVVLNPHCRGLRGAQGVDAEQGYSNHPTVSPSPPSREGQQAAKRRGFKARWAPPCWRGSRSLGHQVGTEVSGGAAHRHRSATSICDIWKAIGWLAASGVRPAASPSQRTLPNASFRSEWTFGHAARSARDNASLRADGVDVGLGAAVAALVADVLGMLACSGVDPAQPVTASVVASAAVMMNLMVAPSKPSRYGFCRGPRGAADRVCWVEPASRFPATAHVMSSVREVRVPTAVRNHPSSRRSPHGRRAVRSPVRPWSLRCS